MITTIDKQRHYGKVIKITISVIAIVLVICIGYVVVWNNLKTNFEKKFETGLHKYGFKQDTFTDDNGNTSKSKDVYSVEKEGVKYIVYKTDFPGILDFKFDTSNSRKFLIAKCSTDDKTLTIRMSNKGIISNVDWKFEKMPEPESNVFTTAIGGEYPLSEAGNLLYKTSENEIMTVYENLQEETQTAVREMQEMYPVFYIKD